MTDSPDPRTAVAQPDAHEHRWLPNGTVIEERVTYSPVSHLDHVVTPVTLAIQSCECGQVRKVAVSVGRDRWLNRPNR
jgi:hypothetical protein